MRIEGTQVVVEEHPLLALAVNLRGVAGNATGLYVVERDRLLRKSDGRWHILEIPDSLREGVNRSPFETECHLATVVGGDIELIIGSGDLLCLWRVRDGHWRRSRESFKAWGAEGHWEKVTASAMARAFYGPPLARSSA